MLRLKIRSSHFICKLANKCLNVREQVEVVEKNVDVSSLSLLSRELSVCVKEKSDKENCFSSVMTPLLTTLNFN